MWFKHWPTSVLLVVVGLSGAGCSLPVRPPAPHGDSPWNPFDKPNVNHSEQAITETVDEYQTKKITDPNPLKLRYAMWMEETGNLPEARKHYSEVLAARPRELEAVLGVARIDLATGSNDLAERGFRRALTLDPRSAIAHSGVGQCQAANKDWAAAVAELTEASQGLPDDKTIRYHLATALVHTNDLAAAQVQFSLCVGEAAGYYNTALILKDVGQLAEAQAQLELALRKDPNMQDAQRWLVELRKVRTSQEQASLRGPAHIQPAVKQVTYKDYGPVGTVEIKPAMDVPNPAASEVVHAGGHSTARP
jgi:tetratricopeptide (TPR) repeat protein